MTWEIVVDDCVEAMRAMDEASVDAVVCDPPYGLEFMGKDWDRLGDIGKTSHAGPRERDGSTVFGRQRVAYSGSSNVRCGRCARWKWDHEGRKCECGPDAIWPNVAAHQARIMQEWHEQWAREAYRVLKPGGHLLAFGGTRTYHRLACAIEDAGFEIRDTIAWMYGSGFPKSLDVSKAIDAAAGAERTERVDPRWIDRYPNGPKGNTGQGAAFEGKGMGRREGTITTSNPVTPDAERWQGWGTALKPAHEPIVVARKPLTSSVAATVLKHGTGALNVDGCRVGTEGGGNVCPGGDDCKCDTDGRAYSPTKHPVRREGEFGRWPANVVLDPEATACLDPGGEWSRFFYVCGGESETAEPTFGGATQEAERSGSNLSTDGSGNRPTDPSPPDTTSITETRIRSTTILPTSSSSSEDDTRPTTADSELPWSSETASADARDAASGSRSTPTPDEPTAPGSPCASPASGITSANGEQPTASGTTPTCGTTGLDSARALYSPKASSAERNAGLDGFEERIAGGMSARTDGSLDGHIVTARNVHPTVKPVALMRWLVRLVTPPGGLILDPFTGSGTTGCAAVLEGFRFVGVEREAEYAAIARARITWWAEHPDGMELVERLQAEKERKAKVDAGQLGLFG